MRKACEKRPVSTGDMERLVDDVEREVFNSLEQEVPTNTVGEMVMRRLKELDEVAMYALRRYTGNSRTLAPLWRSSSVYWMKNSMQGSYLAKAGQFKHGFLYEKSEGIGWYRAASLQVPGLRHGFSTREGGVTTGRKASLNLHWDKDGCEADVLENYRRFARGAGIAYDDMVIVNHAHGANVIQVDRLSRGRGFTLPPLPFCDG